jgi:hypothetical protein
VTEPLFVFRNRLLPTALHLDFVRVRCGFERSFLDGIQRLRGRSGRPHAFAVFSEWDALVALPCESLYPESLTSLYSEPGVVSSISGTAGYFAYLWEHEVNVGDRHDLDDRIGRMTSIGVGVIMSLRYDDLTRRELGLGGDLLFCDYLLRELRKPANAGINALVAHTLGWNDVTLLLHTDNEEQRLLDLLSSIRLLTLEAMIGPGLSKAKSLEPLAGNSVFAASYSHLVGGYAGFMSGRMDLGRIAQEIHSANFLVRVLPAAEMEVRKTISDVCAKFGIWRTFAQMPSEMGHYSFSLDVTDLAKSGRGGRNLLTLMRTVRRSIGKIAGAANDSYAETSTHLRFGDAGQPAATPSPRQKSDPELEGEIKKVRGLLDELPRKLKIAGVSPMTAHRFNSVVTTLLDNLADPVRSSVVRHITRFMLTTPRRITELNHDRDGIDELCHVCEYALAQATDGIAQFQHDAASLGLSGRGGYSRLILAMETYLRDLFALLGVQEVVPLLTFGLKTGSGSTGRFQTDVAFRVVFVPTNWYVLLHEAGHRCWVSSFGWVGESVKTYTAMEQWIGATARTPYTRAAHARAEFIRTRDIVRELFPNYLVYRVSCGGDIRLFDKISLKHILAGRSAGGTPQLMIAVLLHCLLHMTDEAAGGDWWSGWEKRRNENHEQTVQDAIDSLDEAMKDYIDVSVRLAKEKREVREHERTKQNRIIDKQRILKTDMFHEQALSALLSVIEVLTLSSGEFSAGKRKKNDTHVRQFAEFQARLRAAGTYLGQYDSWLRNGFGEWLASGEVLALAPPAWVWSKLLLDVRDQIRAKPPGRFMVSQIGVILSLWHRAVTHRPPASSKRQLNEVLRPLGLVEPKKISSRRARSRPSRSPSP